MSRRAAGAGVTQTVGFGVPVPVGEQEMGSSTGRGVVVSLLESL